MKIKNIFFLLAVMTCVITAQAQDKINPKRKQAIDSLALEKVKDLSKYISIIGDKKNAIFRGSAGHGQGRGAFRAR